jgi:hypothetical protein
MRSVKNGNLKMCKLLIENGASASINIPDKVSIYKYKVKSYVNIGNYRHI